MIYPEMAWQQIEPISAYGLFIATKNCVVKGNTNMLLAFVFLSEFIPIQTPENHMILIGMVVQY